MEAIIKPNDLRYGNKLLFLGEEVTFEFVDQIREDGVFWIQVKERKIAHKNFQFKPIPLTEEWLFRFGFEKVEDDDYLEIKLFSSLKILWLGYLAIEINGYFTALSEKEQVYVNQLQNLYFALTGEELTAQELNQ